MNRKIISAHKKRNFADLVLLYESFGMSKLKKTNIDSRYFSRTNVHIYDLTGGYRFAKNVIKHFELLNDKSDSLSDINYLLN